MSERPPTQDDLFANAVALVFIVSYFFLAFFALWFVFTHL